MCLRQKQIINSRGVTIMEYALVAGLIIITLTAMQLYVKRGIQGRVKQMTDKMIAHRQNDQMDEDFRSASRVETVTPSTSSATIEYANGEINQTLVSGKNLFQESETRYRPGANYAWFSNTSVSADDETVNQTLGTLEPVVDNPALEYQEDGMYPVDTGLMGEGKWWETETDVERLQEARDRINTEIDALDEANQGVIDSAQLISDDASDLGGRLPGGAGERLSQFLGGSNIVETIRNFIQGLFSNGLAGDFSGDIGELGGAASDAISQAQSDARRSELIAQREGIEARLEELGAL